MPLSRAAFLAICALTLARTSASVSEQTCSAASDGTCVAPGSLASTASVSSRPHGLLSRLATRLTALSPGVNGIPLRYIMDMAVLPKPETSWLGVFCDGVIRGCPDKKDWPGPSTLSQIGWERVRELGSQMPANEWAGKWWRGNELGTLINNPFFYAMKGADNGTVLSPLAIALGISPKQHAAIRPIFERAFDIGRDGDRLEEARGYIEESARLLFDGRKDAGKLTHTDIKIWFHQVINKLTFDREVSVDYSRGFIATQGTMLSTQLLSQVLPAQAYGVDPLKMKPTLAQVSGYVAEYKELLREKYSDLLDGKDCAPSASCLDQAAYGVFDAFVAAGGVSVPGTILQALAVLFSTDKTNPAGGPIDFKAEQALALHWEAIRVFPPVVVFPYWSPRPTCAGMTAAETAALNAPNGQTAPCPLATPDVRTGFGEVNQYKGGFRYLPNIAMAQQDPEKWGDDAHIFKIRPLEHYHKYSLGFAEMAVDPDVADGNMNRNCPGKQLSLLMGSVFLRMFKKAEWTVHPDNSIPLKTGGPYVKDFDIFLKTKVDSCREKVCDCKNPRGHLKRFFCDRCVKNKCLV